MTTSVHAPLPTRPRRARVQRPPSPRAAERALRRTAAPTTGRTWRRAGLPGPAVARAGVRPVDALFGLLVVALLAVPLMVWTQAAPAAVALVVAAAVAVLYLAWARRIVVGRDYLALRQLGRYHVATVDHVRHLELRPMQGGVLCLHTDDGRCMRVRRVELERPAVREALRELAQCGEGTRDRRVCALLGLEEERVLDRYVATA